MTNTDTPHCQTDDKNALRHTSWRRMSQITVACSLLIFASILVSWLVFNFVFLEEIFPVMLAIQLVTVAYGLVHLKFPYFFISESHHPIAKIIATLQLGAMCLTQVLSLICVVLIYIVKATAPTLPALIF